MELTLTLEGIFATVSVFDFLLFEVEVDGSEIVRLIEFFFEASGNSCTCWKGRDF